MTPLHMITTYFIQPSTASPPSLFLLLTTSLNSVPALLAFMLLFFKHRRHTLGPLNLLFPLSEILFSLTPQLTPSLPSSLYSEVYLFNETIPDLPI